MYSNIWNRGALNRHHVLCTDASQYIKLLGEGDFQNCLYIMFLSLYVMFFICFTCRINTHPTPSLFGIFVSNVCFKVYKILKHIQGADIIIVYTS